MSDRAKTNKKSLPWQTLGPDCSQNTAQSANHPSRQTGRTQIQPALKGQPAGPAITNLRFWSALVPLPTNFPHAYVYGCSPRTGGNTDFASMLVQSELDALGLSYNGSFLREYELNACTGCQKCDELENEICNLNSSDQARELFNPLLGAQQLFFVSPIYFYHLPAQFKAFIDRGQAYWVQHRLGSPVMHSLPKRKAYIILLCAREKGEEIFQGSLLSLRFFLAPFNIELAEPLLLRNLDHSEDLASRPELQEQILTYVRQACEHK